MSVMSRIRQRITHHRRWGWAPRPATGDVGRGHPVLDVVVGVVMTLLAAVLLGLTAGWVLSRGALLLLGQG